MKTKFSYLTYKNYMVKTYGYALHSIPIDLNLGCPNRDKNGNGGCTFCPENGARAAQTLDAISFEEQIKKGIAFAKNRYKAKEFMLYIQAYTGTFTSVINQKKIYSRLLKLYNFKAISIGTRPDCITKETLEYLKKLNEDLDVYIDLGVQTLNDATLKKINRGHDSNSSINAIKMIKEYGIKIFAHTIIGLEGETRSDWEYCIKKLSSLNVTGIKIHNLHIIKKTQLAKEYLKKSFKILNEYEYAEEVINLIKLIPNHIVIVRISTDTPKENLIQPKWNMQKGQFFEYVNECMKYSNYFQGDSLDTKQNYSLSSNINEKEFLLKDGSKTIWDKKYKDYYHPKSGAFLQAKKLFIDNSNIIPLLKRKNINLLDIGFGMGYNSLEAINLNKKNKLKITALDKNRNIIKTSSILQDKEKNKIILENIYKNLHYKDKYNELTLYLNDARHSITKIKQKFNIIFLDPFDHFLNPSLITEDFLKLVISLLEDDGILVCSGSSTYIQNALNNNYIKTDTFHIDRTDIKGIFGRKISKKTNYSKTYKDPNLIYREKQIINFSQ